VIKKYNSHIIAVVGTLIFMVIVFLLLWFLRMTMTPPTDEEDIEVTLEYELDVEEILEQEENVPDELPQQQDVEKPTTATQPPKTPTQKSEPPKSSNNNPLVNNNNETLKENTDTIGNFINELPWDTVSEEKPTSPDTTSSPEPPIPPGPLKVDGISCSLDGRGCNLLKKPGGSVTEIGKIVVEIIVDKDGNVFSAKVTHKGTTITDKAMQDMAVEAAKGTRFTPATATQPEIQMGTITYEYIDKKS
jgi:TonB family protein